MELRADVAACMQTAHNIRSGSAQAGSVPVPLPVLAALQEQGCLLCADWVARHLSVLHLRTEASDVLLCLQWPCLCPDWGQ